MTDDVYPDLSRIKEAMTGDIIHLTCHGKRDEKGDYWILGPKDSEYNGLRVYSDTELKYLAEGLNEQRPLIFGNACSLSSVSATSTFGDAFFGAGALAFIGTFASVSQNLAVEFAARFYNHLLANTLPIGEALWRTKTDFSEAGEINPSYLFYCLYGPPDTSFVRTLN
jgi:CHAT domain-containing protein